MRSSITLAWICMALALGCTSSEPHPSARESAPEPPAVEPVVSMTEAEARRAGILGSLQAPGGDFASGSGCILLGDEDEDVWAGLSEPSNVESSKRVAQIRQAKISVGEGLERDVVRRLVRGHIAELRACYDAGLGRNPTLAGRIEIAFEIDATGKVSTSSVEAATLEPVEDRVPACFAKAVQRWRFPEPTTGAAVRVVHPFVLSPG